MHAAEVVKLTVGDLATNCYLLWCPETSETIIIDPADSGDYITSEILQRQLTPKYIVLTHGHFDHVLGCLELKLNFQVPVLLHPADNFLLARAASTAQHFVGHQVDPVPPADDELTDGQILKFGGHQLQILHTPGHTPGSITAYTDDFVFTGDTLFAEEDGKADRSYSSETELQDSLQKIKKLSINRQILAGHEN